MRPKKRPRRYLEQAIRAARRLDASGLEKLVRWLEAYTHQLAEDLEHPAPDPTSKGTDKRVRGRVTYQRELVRCGKAGCHCSSSRGALHGPYWYAYVWRGGRVRKLYIGKFLKDD